ncbi:sulfate adenylyltransferase (ADP) / ATP adenylyltransferase [Entomortierella parvispora]|uniref:Sulfate adenylyltransferase (ADP) / ATP adenylyltransferase n=1 Tax=Entomortierella parvispora TaxID=205924 RepID=A0A9P3H8G7_9FUNG|nr:sulfate adenylyltransferase (ADP) / ATP adenylyltransferase [Entomortierella parvispora]
MAKSLANFDAKLSSVYQSALESGELIFTASETVKSTETEYEVDCEICYAPALARKPQGVLPVVEADPNPKVTSAPTTSGDLHTAMPSTPVKKRIEKTNPFLPHSPALYVTDIGEEHKVLLNKFCIVPRHFLVVTKEFHPQTEPLSPQDMLAVWSCLNAVKDSRNALAFYNCGSRSGASQPHKHMQVIPLETPSPISILVRETSMRRPGKKENRPGDIISVPFNCINHVYLLPDPAQSDKDEEEILIEAYISLMDAMMTSIREYADQESLSDEEKSLCANGMSSFAYNWILTKEFMMIVPRKQASSDPVDGVSLDVNSLGFACMVLAKTPEVLTMVQKKGVINTVSETGFCFLREYYSPEKEQQRKEQQAILEKQMAGAFSGL